MKYFAVGLIFLLSQSSCSSVAVPHKSPSMTLQDVEQIKLGEDSRQNLETKFGMPSEEHSIDSDHIVIFYDQQASFVISKKNDRVLTALWIPSQNDELRDLKKLKSHFDRARFSIQKQARSVPNESTLEYSLVDRNAGISIDVSKTNQKVSSVSFSLPSNRQIGSAPEK